MAVIDERDRTLVLKFKERLPLELARHLKRIIVFGSRVKGEADEDSDLDVIALVDEKATDIEKQMENVAYQIMRDYNFMPIISLKIFSESRYYDALNRGFSFYKHVEKEGVSI